MWKNRGTDKEAVGQDALGMPGNWGRDVDTGGGVPWQARCGPEGSMRFRLPDFMTFGTWRWWGCQPHASAAFTSRKCSWYSFSLGAESTPGPCYDRKEICHWKIQWHQRESIPGPSECRYKPYNISYLLFNNLLIPSDLVKLLTTILTKTEKLRNDFYVIPISLAKLHV
jgi:hypothetical protein